MIQVYVTELPGEANQCPFFVASSKKCNVSKSKCSLAVGNKCENLIDLKFELEPLEETTVNAVDLKTELEQSEEVTENAVQ